jgi:hypothetical protein
MKEKPRKKGESGIVLVKTVGAANATSTHGHVTHLGLDLAGVRRRIYSPSRKHT